MRGLIKGEDGWMIEMKGSDVMISNESTWVTGLLYVYCLLLIFYCLFFIAYCTCS